MLLPSKPIKLTKVAAAQCWRQHSISEISPSAGVEKLVVEKLGVWVQSSPVESEVRGTEYPRN